MAIENAPYIAGLSPSIPANTDPRAEGAAQIRATKTALKNSFPAVDASVTASAARMNEVFNNPSQVPIGAILMWSGASNPEGWADCDGNVANGFLTPNLRGMFIQGATTAGDIGVTGGNNNPTLSNHVTVDEHALGINELPAHKHDYVDRYYAESKNKLTSEGAGNIMSNDSTNTVGSNSTDSDNDGMLFVNAETATTGSGAGHTHGLTDNPNSVFDNRPTFYTLKYIVYVGI